MKARLLKKLLNDTGYAISNNDEYIAVGSPLCHNLISVNKETLKVKYALDAFREGRKSLDGESKLLFILDKLHELVESGEIHEIINGKDEIENPLPVFTVSNGQLIESVTDKYGWPNTDDNGVCMYENTHFPTKEQALEYGIRESKAWLKMLVEREAEKRKELAEIKKGIHEKAEWVSSLKSILENLPK